MIHSIEEAVERIESILELKNKLVFDHFTESQQLPFAAYKYNFDTDGANDYNGVVWIDFTLELYSERRNLSLEHKILIVFDDVKIKSSNDYIEAEQMYMTTFRFSFPYKLTHTIP